MSDQSMAAVGRRLAEALSMFARERDMDGRKAIAQLHTELCQAWREDQVEIERD